MVALRVKLRAAIRNQNEEAMANMEKYCSHNVFERFGFSPANCGNETEVGVWPRPASIWLGWENGDSGIIGSRASGLPFVGSGGGVVMNAAAGPRCRLTSPWPSGPWDEDGAPTYAAVAAESDPGGVSYHASCSAVTVSPRSMTRCSRSGLQLRRSSKLAATSCSIAASIRDSKQVRKVEMVGSMRSIDTRACCNTGRCAKSMRGVEDWYLILGYRVTVPESLGSTKISHKFGP